MQIDIGIQYSKLHTDNQKLLQALRSLYSFSVPGAAYTSAGRSGRWNGKTNFITVLGKFRTGLLPRILEDLKRIECEPTLNYTYDRNLITPENWKIDGYTLRDYQEEAILVGVSNHRGVIQAPTGAGKTLIMAAIIKALQGRKITLLFDAKHLLTQTYKFLTDTCGIDNIGLCYGEGYIYGDIMLCTVQSIEKILDTHLEETEVLMVDECHKFANGTQRLAAIKSFPNAQYRLGFTATVPRESIPLYNLEGALGKTHKVRTTKDLVEEGHLTKPSIQMLSMDQPKENYQGYNYNDMYEVLIVENEERNQKIVDIVNTIRSNHEKARILILVNRLEHGQNLQSLLEGSCFYLRGEDDIGERYSTIRRFVSCPESSVLLGTRILETGVDIREITHFINARGLKSPIATIQALGRSLRLHDNKDQVFIYDFMDKGRYLAAHSRKRYNTYKKEGHEVEIL
jgi:superfamily II DNA or RNA helicase